MVNVFKSFGHGLRSVGERIIHPRRSRTARAAEAPREEVEGGSENAAMRRTTGNESARTTTRRELDARDPERNSPLAVFASNIEGASSSEKAPSDLGEFLAAKYGVSATKADEVAVPSDYRKEGAKLRTAVAEGSKKALEYAVARFAVEHRFPSSTDLATIHEMTGVDVPGAGEYRKNDPKLPISAENNATPAGIVELREKLEEGGILHEWAIDARKIMKSFAPDAEVLLAYDPQDRRDVAKKVDEVFRRMKKEIKGAGGKRAAIRRILVARCQDLNQLQPFQDGNTRATVTVLLNALLIKYGQPPAILENPRIFNGYDVRALDRAIAEGQERFGA
jgi:hypothetical protein